MHTPSILLPRCHAGSVPEPGPCPPSCSLPGQNFVASPDGSLLVVITPSSVDVYDAAGKTKVGRGVRPGRT